MAKNRTEAPAHDPKSVAVANLTAQLKFDSIAPQEIDVEIPSGPNGAIEDYILQEPTADAGVRYKDNCARATRMEDGKLVGFSGMGEAEIQLVADCLFKRVPRDNDVDELQPVGRAAVGRWPDKVFRTLFDMLEKMSPGLRGRETPESLDKKITELQTRRRAMSNGEDHPKN